MSKRCAAIAGANDYPVQRPASRRMAALSLDRIVILTSIVLALLLLSKLPAVQRPADLLVATNGQAGHACGQEQRAGLCTAAHRVIDPPLLKLDRRMSTVGLIRGTLPPADLPAGFDLRKCYKEEHEDVPGTVRDYETDQPSRCVRPHDTRSKPSTQLSARLQLARRSRCAAACSVR